MPKILVAPGSGDIHWVMLKMESIIEQHFKGETPEVWVWSESRRTERSEGYVKRIPFVKWGGYYHASPLDVKVGQQVFVAGKPWLFKPWRTFDMFVAFNAPLGWGTNIAKLMTNCDINWNYELRLTQEDLAYGLKLLEQIGPYIPVSFFGHSFYSKWLQIFNRKHISDLLAKLRKTHTVVLTGREWDAKFMSAIGGAGDIDLTGKTSMGELLGLCNAASAFVGFAAGNGMLAQHLGTPTFMLWDSAQWHPDFATNWVDPERRKNGTYHALDIRNPNITNYIGEKLERHLPTDSPA